jgi:hypothetical protein
MPTSLAVYRVIRSIRHDQGGGPGRPANWKRRLDQLADRAAQFLPLFEDGPPDLPTGRRSGPQPPAGR